MKYDYLIVGSGLYGCVFAREAHDAGKKVLVVEKRSHTGGNIYTENIEGIEVHKYGAHIFHTDKKEIWEYVNRFVSFNTYRHKVIADYRGERYDLPFNMHTFHQMWGVETPEQAKKIIESQKSGIKVPENLEEQCISLVGTELYEKLVKGYTEKQWGRDCKKLPSSIIQRLPVRFGFDSDYFDDEYQGIPIGGYARLIENLLKGIEVRTDYDFLKHRDDVCFDKLVFTGPIDAYYEYCYGKLEYRSLRFVTERRDVSHYQNNAVINYTDNETPYTRIIEHKYFDPVDCRYTFITKEFPCEWKNDEEPFYPINDEKNTRLYRKYKELSEKQDDVIFGGRLGEYRYYDMDEVIQSALAKAKQEIRG